MYCKEMTSAVASEFVADLLKYQEDGGYNAIEMIGKFINNEMTAEEIEDICF